MKVESLQEARARRIVEALEKMLERARSGDVVGLALVYETHDAYGHEFACDPKGLSWGIVAELEFAKISAMIAMGRLKPPT